MTEVHRQNNRRWQFSMLALLLIPLGTMLAIIYYHRDQVELYSATTGSTFCQTLLQSMGMHQDLPVRDIPANYTSVGSVDDQYKMVVNPKTGQMMIHDALGGLATNVTSVDGSRARLAKDMISLDEYAILHKNTLSPNDYNWLRHLARTGMKLAFGAPGQNPDMQIVAKQELLIEFHNLSANPSSTMAHSDIFLQAEQASKTAEAAYQQITEPTTIENTRAATGSRLLSDVTGALGSLMAIDPVSPALSSVPGMPLDASAVGTLAAQVSPILLTPSAVNLALTSTPINTVSTSEAIASNSATPVLSSTSSAGTIAPTVDAATATVANSINASVNISVASPIVNTSVGSTVGSASSPDTAVNASASVAASIPITSSGITSSVVPTASQQVTQTVSSTTSVSSGNVLSVGNTTTGTLGNNWSSGLHTSTTTGKTSVQNYYQTIFNSK